MNNSEFILLHKTKFGESSLVLHALSKEYGRRGFLVKSVARKTSASLYLPLNILEGDVQENTRSRLFTIRNVVSRYPLIGIRNSFAKNAMSMFISEVLYRVVKDGVYDPGLYEMCEKDILLLDAMDADFSNFHIRFLLELAVEMGFCPDMQELEPFMGNYLHLMDDFLNLSFPEAMLIPLSGEARNDMAERLLRYIEYHTESSLNVNSLKVLRELFQSSDQM